MHCSADSAGTVLPAGVLAALLVAGMLLMLLIALRWLSRLRLHTSGFTRLMAGAVAAVLLLALPLLALHAIHHADGDENSRCAVAGIAHSVAGGVLTTPPALAPPSGEGVSHLPYLRTDAERPPFPPTARGPPCILPAA